MEAKETEVVEGEDWEDSSPIYISKHVACPECGDAMNLYVGLWQCWCGHQEPCCE
jgi:NifU-like protein involved in Fe-S cluster formation